MEAWTSRCGAPPERPPPGRYGCSRLRVRHRGHVRVGVCDREIDVACDQGGYGVHWFQFDESQRGPGCRLLDELPPGLGHERSGGGRERRDPVGAGDALAQRGHLHRGDPDLVDDVPALSSQQLACRGERDATTPTLGQRQPDLSLQRGQLHNAASVVDGVRRGSTTTGDRHSRPTPTTRSQARCRFGYPSDPDAPVGWSYLSIRMATAPDASVHRVTLLLSRPRPNRSALGSVP